jgi:hypothetical protein
MSTAPPTGLDSRPMPPNASPHRPRIIALLREYPDETAPQIAARLAQEGVEVSVPLVVKVSQKEGLRRKQGRPADGRSGARDLVLSLSAEGLDSEEIAAALEAHDIAARADPDLAHEPRIGTSRRLVQHYLRQASATETEEK